MALSESKKLKYCVGCREDFYNGHNPYDIKRCWCLKSAKVVWRKLVHVDDRPPFDHKAQRVLDCYTKSRHICIEPKERW